MQGLHWVHTSFWSSARAPGARTLRRVLPEMASLQCRLLFSMQSSRFAAGLHAHNCPYTQLSTCTYRSRADCMRIAATSFWSGE